MWEAATLGGVIRCGEHESETQTPRNPIGRPGTNGNRGRGNTPFVSRLKEQLKSFMYFSYRRRPGESRFKHTQD